MKLDGMRCTRVASNGSKACWQHQKSGGLPSPKKTVKKKAPVSTRPTKLPKKTVKLPQSSSFKKLYNVINKLEPDEKYNIKKSPTIRFIRKVVKTQKIPGVCNFKASLVDTRKKYRARITILFAEGLTRYKSQIPKFFLQYVRGCKKPVIVIQLALRFEYRSGHANLLIINTLKKEVERFEPHGELPSPDGEIIDAAIKKVVLEALKGYTYITPLDYCPKVGPQTFAMRSSRSVKTIYTERTLELVKAGKIEFCTLWSTLYGYLRVLEGSLTREHIITQMFKLSEIPYFIQKYSTYVKTILKSKKKS